MEKIFAGKDLQMIHLMYSTKQAAERLGLSQDHIRLLARTGVIKARKIGRDWIVLDLNYTRKRKPKVSKG